MSRWYGSFQNRLMENSKQREPEVGMGATEICYSDRHPYEIIAVKDERHITVRRLDAKRIDNYGMSDVQDYEYKSNPNNHPINLFKDKNGKWRERYPDRHLGCNRFVIGFAEEYYDFSF